VAQKSSCEGSEKARKNGLLDAAPTFKKTGFNKKTNTNEKLGKKVSEKKKESSRPELKGSKGH